tara:strand:- start:43 stop:267 length:225 start_codon:yes stop_codon:yes gene_type:complete
MEIFSGFILMMFMGGADTPTEFTPRDSMVHCLTTKRKIKRTQGPSGPRWVCQEGEIEMIIINGDKHPNKLLSLD